MPSTYMHVRRRRARGQSCEDLIKHWRLSTPPTDGEDDGKPLAKRQKLPIVQEEETCLVCLEDITETQSLTKTACCNQTADISCLKKYYDVPESCVGLLEHKQV